MTTQCSTTNSGERRLRAPKQSSTPGCRTEKRPGVEKRGRQTTASVTATKDRHPGGKQSRPTTTVVSNTSKPTVSCGEKETQTAVAAASAIEDAKLSERNVAGQLLEHCQFVDQRTRPHSNKEHRTLRRHRSVPAAMPTEGQHRHQQRMLSPVWYPPYPYYPGCYPFVAPDSDVGPSMATNSDPAVLLRLRQSHGVDENSRNLGRRNQPHQWPPWTLPFACPPGVWPGSFSPSAPKPTQRAVRNEHVRQVVSHILGTSRLL